VAFSLQWAMGVTTIRDTSAMRSVPGIALSQLCVREPGDPGCSSGDDSVVLGWGPGIFIWDKDPKLPLLRHSEGHTFKNTGLAESTALGHKKA
jgi:hypothetical protein